MIFFLKYVVWGKAGGWYETRLAPGIGLQLELFGELSQAYVNEFDAPEGFIRVATKEGGSL
jgi:hypothetical protein